MLIHPWDAALGEHEWREWFGRTDRFGMLVVNNSDAAHAPLVVPAHATLVGEDLLLHLARPNPVWSHVAAAEEVRFVVIGDYAFVPGHWRARDDRPEDGVPTSYYSALQLVCRPTVVDDPEQKAEILRHQLEDQQPEGRHAEVSPEAAPYGRMLSGIRGLRLAVLRAEAKFKYDDHKPVAHRERVADHLEARDRGLDRQVAAQQRRRLDALGEWKDR